MSTESSYEISEGCLKKFYDSVIDSTSNPEERQKAISAITQSIGIQNMALLAADMAANPETWEKHKELVLSRMDSTSTPTAPQGSQSILGEKINKVQKMFLTFLTLQKYNIPYSTYEAFMNECMKQEQKTPIIHAVIKGNIDMVKVLYELGNDINEMSQDGETPLTQAISKGNIEMAKLLIELGANVNQATKKGITPMSMAVIHENPRVRKEMVGDLHAKGAELDRPGQYGWTPMFQAAKKGYLDTMKLLYDLNSKDVNEGKAFPINLVGPIKIAGIVKSLPDVLLDYNQLGAEGLLRTWIAKQKYGIEDLYKKLDEKILLLRPESSVEEQEGINEVINKEMIKFIKMSDADLVQEVVNHMETCEQYKRLIEKLPQGGPEELQSILREKLLEKVEKIQQIIGNIFKICPIQKVLEACSKHKIEILEYFMFMYECRDKTMPIMQAVATKNTKMIQVLHALGFDMNALDKKGGYTPLIWAVNKEDSEIIRLLCDLDANINQPGEDGATPLTWAISNGDIKIVRLLCELGADVNLICNGEHQGLTPMSEVIGIENIDKEVRKAIINCLFEHGAVLDQPDKDGLTPMCIVAMRNDIEIMQLLYDLGKRDPKNSINLNCLINTNDTKDNVLLLSDLILSGNSAAAELLKEWGADQKSALDIIARLRIANIWGLTGNSKIMVDGKEIKFQLTGMYRNYGIPMLYEHVNDFLNSNLIKTNDEEKKMIRNSIANAFPLLNDDAQICNKIKLGEPVVFLTGSEGHTISIIIQGNQVAICNRGEGRAKNSIEFYAIPKSYTDQEIMEMINILKTDHSDMEAFNTMIKSLKFNSNPLGEIHQKDQEVGNCVWASSKEIFGILCMFLRNNDISVMNTIYKDFTAYTRIRELTEYLKNAHGGTLDVNILQQIREKILEKTDKNKNPDWIPAELVEKLQELIELQKKEEAQKA